MKEREFRESFEEICEKFFKVNASLRNNLEEQLKFSSRAYVCLSRHGLNDSEFERAIEPIKKYADENALFMEVLPLLPENAINTDGYLVREKTNYFLEFRRKQKNEQTRNNML